MKALLVVDIQKDFMPDGNLPVPNGYDTVPVANRVMEKFHEEDDIIVATQDWHPPDHGSFASNHDGKDVFDVTELDGREQILWPDHCIQGSEGARFVEGLRTKRFQALFRKGVDPLIDSYSGFHDNGHERSTGLAGYLREKGVDETFILGVATDVCVKFTALDSIREGFQTNLIVDGCRGVDQQEGDVKEAIEKMESEGVSIRQSEGIL